MKDRPQAKSRKRKTDHQRSKHRKNQTTERESSLAWYCNIPEEGEEVAEQEEALSYPEGKPEQQERKPSGGAKSTTMPTHSTSKRGNNHSNRRRKTPTKNLRCMKKGKRHQGKRVEIKTWKKPPKQPKQKPKKQKEFNQNKPPTNRRQKQRDRNRPTMRQTH